MQNKPINYHDYHLILTPSFKCFDPNLIFPCIKYSLENYTRDKKCNICWKGYYRTPEGLCVGFSSLVKRIPNCGLYNFTIKNISLSLDFDEEFEFIEINSEGENYDIILAEFFKNEIKEEIESTCFDCDYGYILTNDGNCRELKSEDCSFNSIINNYEKLKYGCYDFCKVNNMVLIEINGIYLDYLWYNNFNKSIYNLGDSINMKVCLNSSG